MRKLKITGVLRAVLLVLTVTGILLFFLFICSTLVRHRDLTVNVLDLGVVIRNFINDLLHALAHKEEIVVHHGDLHLGNALDALDLRVVQQKFLSISFR